MKVLIALGGNALLIRGQAPTSKNQKENISIAAKQISKIVKNNDVIISHGNGPQVGLLALQSENYKEVEAYPFDVLVAETEGMIGYLLQQQLYNELSGSRPVVSLITQVEVDENDPAFKNPTKPIGQVYNDEEVVNKLAREKGWVIVKDGNYFRRAIASPKPKRIVELDSIKSLLNSNTITICSGGGGVPVKVDKNKKLIGVEAVIDKDLSSSLLAKDLDFDLFVIATDVEGVFINWGKSDQKILSKVTVGELIKGNFSSGSMAPKVEAAIQFTKNTGRRSVIGSLNNIEDIIKGDKGTQIIP